MKKIKLFISLLTFLQLFTGCVLTNFLGFDTSDSVRSTVNVPDTREVVEKPLSADEKEIYNYIFTVLLQNNPYGSRNSIMVPTSKIVLSCTTKSSKDYELNYEESSKKSRSYFEKVFEQKYLEAFDSFIETNKSFNNISDLIQSDSRLVSSESVKERIADMTGSYWEKFYTAEPESCGELKLSNIGFSANNDIAVVEVEFHQRAMSGYIDYLVFGKENNKWTIINSNRHVYF